MVVALRIIEKNDSTIRHIHTVAVREGDLSDDGRADFGLGDPGLAELTTPPVLTEVGDRG